MPADLRARLGRWETLTVVLLIAAIVYGAISADGFLSGQNLNSVLSDVSEIALIALPLTLIIVAAEIDLSVASVLGLTSALLGSLWNHNWPIEAIIPVVIVVGALCGGVNGVLVTRLGLPSLAVTIGTLALYRGLAFVILGDQAVTDFPTNYLDFGQGTFAGTEIPNPTILFVVLAVIFGVTLHRTAVGRAIFAIGANDEAARFAGLRVKRIKFWLFVISGTLSGFAGVLWTLRFASARYDAGAGLELYVVTIVLLGGVSIFGGRGTIVGVVLAVAVLGCLQTALTADLIPAQDQNIVVGVLLIASVIIPNSGELFRRARARLRSAEARHHAAAAAQAEGQ
jgi:rhamnose transport system permease protein